MNTNHLSQFSVRSSSLREAAAKIFGTPWQLLRAAHEAAGRRRETARLRAEVAALDQHVLTDIGLRRSLVDRSQLLRPPFPCA